MQNHTAGSITPIDVQRQLKGLSYPAEKRKIIERARQNGAEDRIIRTLEELPDRTYEEVTEVSAALAEQR